MMEENGLPKGWVETTLGVAVNVKHGFAFKGEFISLEPNNKILITPGNFNIGGGFKNDKFKYYTGSIPEDYILKENEVIVTMTDLSKDGDTLGFPAKVPKDDNIYLHNQRIGLVLLKSCDFDKEYIYWLLRTKYYQKSIINSATGSTVRHTSPSRIQEYSFFCPPLPEQKAIAAILTTFDDKIELLQAQNQTLEATAQTIFKEWFGKYQIGDDLPEGWRVGKLGDIINLYDSQRIPLSKARREERKGDYRYYGATSIMDYIDGYIFDGIYLLFAEDGSVIDENGNPILQYVWGKFWVNNHAHIMQGANGFSTEMLYVLCKGIRVDSIISGAVQLKINQRNLLGFDIVIPKEELLQKLDNLIQPFFEKVRTNNDQIQTLQQTRDTLLPKLMSGQLRVDDFR